MRYGDPTLIGNPYNGSTNQWIFMDHWISRDLDHPSRNCPANIVLDMCVYKLYIYICMFRYVYIYIYLYIINYINPQC